uniref:HMG box domain-containing protein n=1 Tax=Glossina brevipalpis TaxID=37001 RepID=A0A1A9W7R2_9MUSC
MFRRSETCDSTSGNKTTSDQPMEGTIYENSSAPTAFFVFLYEFRELIKKSCLRNLTQVEICRSAGRRWRQMSSEDKEPYTIWARRNRAKRRNTMRTRRVSMKRFRRALFFQPSGLRSKKTHFYRIKDYAKFDRKFNDP